MGRSRVVLNKSCDDPGPWRPDRLSHGQGFRLERGKPEDVDTDCVRKGDKKHTIDAQRAPVHSSGRGALLRLCEAICDFCRFHVQDSVRLAFAEAIAQRRSNCRRRRFGPAFLASRHRDPAPVGVFTLSRWSHRSSIAVELTSSKEGTFCFRPALLTTAEACRCSACSAHVSNSFATSVTTLSHYCVGAVRGPAR